MSYGDIYNGDDVQPIRSKEQEIPRNLWDPHYTDKRFTRTGAKTVYLAADRELISGSFSSERVEGAFYNYSDRLPFDKVRAAQEHAAEIVGQGVFSALYFESMLQHVYDEPTTELIHIVAGVNVSTGYSYRVFGTISG